jgi:hypothetical protein
MKEILNRRRSRGYAWIYRNRNVVALAKATNLSPGASLTSGVSLTPDVSLTPSLASKKESMSSAFVEATPDFDDDARRQLVDACRLVAPDVDDSEIATFTTQKRAQLGRRKGIQNLVGLLLTAVPKAMEGSELLRYREEKAQEVQDLARQTRRKDPQYAENIASLEQTLADPRVSEAEKIRAREDLAILKTG